MENYHQMIARHEEEIRRLQRDCNHEEIGDWQKEIGLVRRCKICNKLMMWKSDHEHKFGEKKFVCKGWMARRCEICGLLCDQEKIIEESV